MCLVCGFWPGRLLSHSSQWLCRVLESNNSCGCIYFHWLLKWDVLFSSGGPTLRQPVLYFKISPHKEELFPIAQHNTSWQIRSNGWGFFLPHPLPFSVLTLSFPLFYTEPADRLDVLPAWWPHRLLGRLSEESQRAWWTWEGAVGYLCRPWEEASSSS